jgi:hypothetical protein
MTTTTAATGGPIHFPGPLLLGPDGVLVAPPRERLEEIAATVADDALLTFATRQSGGALRRAAPRSTGVIWSWPSSASRGPLPVATSLREVRHTEREQKEPQYLPMPADATPLQIMIEVEDRIRSMGIEISDAEDVFGFWLREQGPAVHELVATVNRTEVVALAEKIRGIADNLLDKIRDAEPATLADAIALLECCPPTRQSKR